MALWDEVVARYSDEHLVALTNPDNRENTTIDQGRADAAVADALADFFVRCQETFDEAIATHVVPAVAGVIAYLQKRGGSASGISRISVEDFRKDLDRLAKSRKRRRLLPATISPLEPSDESEEVDLMPDFDRSRFRDIIPEKKGETRYFDHLDNRDP